MPDIPWNPQKKPGFEPKPVFPTPREPEPSDPAFRPLFPPGDIPQNGLYLHETDSLENGAGIFPQDML